MKKLARPTRKLDDNSIKCTEFKNRLRGLHEQMRKLIDDFPEAWGDGSETPQLLVKSIEAARMLGMGRSHFSRGVRDGHIPSVRVPWSDDRYFRVEKLRELVARWERDGSPL